MEEKLKETLNQRPVREIAQRLTYTEALNVSESERFMSILAGLLLSLVAGLRRSWASFLFLLAGGYMLFRGVTGYCLIYRVFGIRSVSQAEKRQIERGERAKYQQAEPTKTGIHA